MKAMEEEKGRISNKSCPKGMTIEEWQIALRCEQAEHADFIVRHLDNNRIWGDYSVESRTGGCYRTAFRGVLSEKNYCACLDFRTNGLGTCKHLEAVQTYLREEVEGYPWAGISYSPAYTSIYVNYKGGRTVQIRVGNDLSSEFRKLKESYFDDKGVLTEDKFYLLDKICEEGESISKTFRCYDDVKDFVQEVLNKQQWQSKLRNTYPSMSISWSRGEQDDLKLPLSKLLYKLCYQINGLILASKSFHYPLLIAHLIDELYLHLEEQGHGFVILSSPLDVEQWERVFSSNNYCQLRPIHILLEDEFVKLVDQGLTDCSFVYVDRADGLKEWKNPLSIALKKLKVEHLYMHLTSLEQLTPVQMSSILQHISPFILGPFYQFIHSSREIFPLKDDASNLPDSLKPLLTIVPDLNKLLSEDMEKVSNEDWKILPKDKQAEMLFNICLSLLEDEDGIKLLKHKLHRLLNLK